MRLILIILFFIPFLGLSQDKKIEREESIDKEKMPVQAQIYLENNLPENFRRLKYYFETDGDSQSYEAKFKYRGHRYSVEFNKEGILQDIEVMIERKAVYPASLKSINTFLKSRHERFKIEKIQAQFLPGNTPEACMQRSLRVQKTWPDNYELIVATKNQGKLKKYEFLFDRDGNLKEEREIIRNSYDYLIF